VSTSTRGAESTGSGAAQIKMVTRSGSNRFSGAAYNYWRNQRARATRTRSAREEGQLAVGPHTPYWFNKRDRSKTAAASTSSTTSACRRPASAWRPDPEGQAVLLRHVEWFKWPNSPAASGTS